MCVYIKLKPWCNEGSHSSGILFVQIELHAERHGQGAAFGWKLLEVQSLLYAVPSACLYCSRREPMEKSWFYTRFPFLSIQEGLSKFFFFWFFFYPQHWGMTSRDLCMLSKYVTNWATSLALVNCFLKNNRNLETSQTFLDISLLWNNFIIKTFFERWFLRPLAWHSGIPRSYLFISK